MECKSRSPRREKVPPQCRHVGGETIDIACRSTDGLTESLQRQLQAMHSTFLTASDSILAQISETGSQLDQLEKRIDEMVEEAGSFRVNSSASKRSQMQMPFHEENCSSQQ